MSWGTELWASIIVSFYNIQAARKPKYCCFYRSTRHTSAVSCWL